MGNNRIGCLGTILILAVVGIFISYWYIFLIIAGIAILIYLQATKSSRVVAKEAAKKEAEEAEIDRKINQLRKYKKLLDEGIITQAEFEEKKDSLNFNDLKF